MSYYNFFEDVMQVLQRIESKVDKVEVKQFVPPEPYDDHCGVKYIMDKYHRSYSWVTQHTMSNHPDPLPHKKFGRDLIFSKLEVDAYMEARMISKVGESVSITKHLQEVAQGR